MNKLTEVQKSKRYRQFLKYKVVCQLPGAEQYCNKHSRSPCCFFCKDKQICSGACQNEPIGCNYSACKDKNGGIKIEDALQRLRSQTATDK